MKTLVGVELFSAWLPGVFHASAFNVEPRGVAAVAPAFVPWQLFGSEAAGIISSLALRPPH